MARLRFTSHGVAATLEQPVVWRYKAGGGGEKRKVVNVVPLLSARVSPAMTVVPVAGTATRREVGSSVFQVFSGGATVRVGGSEWDVARGDLFVVPSWQPLTLTTGEGVDLFRFSDTPIFDRLDQSRTHVEGTST